MDACNYKISVNNENNRTGSSIGAPFFASTKLKRYELIKLDEVKQTNTASTLRPNFGLKKKKSLWRCMCNCANCASMGIKACWRRINHICIQNHFSLQPMNPSMR